jgi:hypothetical protein
MQCVPYEVEPVTINQDDKKGRRQVEATVEEKKIYGERLPSGERRDAGETGMRTGSGKRRTGTAISNELACERRAKFMFGNHELPLEQLFLEALPEEPDLLGKLGVAVIERIDVRDIPYRDVPLICSGLWLLKEYWREHLLRGAIDEATGITNKKAYGKRARSTRDPS